MKAARDQEQAIRTSMAVMVESSSWEVGRAPGSSASRESITLRSSAEYSLCGGYGRARDVCVVGTEAQGHEVCMFVCRCGGKKCACWYLRYSGITIKMRYGAKTRAVYRDRARSKCIRS